MNMKRNRKGKKQQKMESNCKSLIIHISRIGKLVYSKVKKNEDNLKVNKMFKNALVKTAVDVVRDR